VSQGQSGVNRVRDGILTFANIGNVTIAKHSAAPCFFPSPPPLCHPPVFLSVAATSLPSSRSPPPPATATRRCSVRVPGALLTALVVTSQVSTPAATSWVHPRRTPPRHPHRRTGALLTAAATSRVSTPARFLLIRSVGCFADRSPDLTLVVRGSRSVEGYTIAGRIKIEGKSSSSLSLSLYFICFFFLVPGLENPQS
jgi:hypothetical protein